MEIKFLVTNDWHLSMRNPVSRTDDYTEELFSLLDQIKRVAIKLKVAGILNAGDIFNENRTPVPAALVNRICQWLFDLKREGIEVFAIPGNHDLRYDRLDSLKDMPLGTLFVTEMMRNVSFNPTYPQNTHVIVTGVPWPSSKTIEDFQLAAMGLPHPIVSERVRICMAHCFATSAGGTFFGEKAHAYTELSELPFEVFCFGHDHSDHGVVELNGKFFINIGALSRGSQAKENINRHVKVALITVDDSHVQVQQVRLNYRPAAEIFDLQLRAQKERETDKIEEFVEKLSADLEVDETNYKDKLTTMPMSSEVRTKVVTYLEKAELSA